MWIHSHFSGTKEIFSGVDEEGNIYLAFDCKEATDASEFTWCKSYEEIDDTDKFNIETSGDQWVLHLCMETVDICSCKGLFACGKISNYIFLFDAFSSKMYFKNPDKSDLGTYSIAVTDTDGASSSFVMDEEGKTTIVSSPF